MMSESVKSEISAREVWNQTFSDSGSQAWYPDEQLVRFAAGYLRKRTGVEEYLDHTEQSRRPRVLDLGCGRGRHVVFFAANGMEVSGCDISDVALEFAANWLRYEGLKANLTVCGLDALPFAEAYFDAVVCHGVLDHVFPDLCSKAIEEATRVLRPGGYFFASFIAKDDCGWGKGVRWGDSDTWIISEGYEANAPQTFFDEDKIVALLRNDFEVKSLNKVVVESLRGKPLIGSDKEYPRDSRFYVVAVKN